MKILEEKRATEKGLFKLKFKVYILERLFNEPQK